MSNSIHQFTTNDLSGKEFDLGSLKGKKAMIVNTASKCGLTPQYKQLQAIYETYGSNGFVIVGFPANNFMAQEPGSDAEIADFCEANYGVTFPMMSKIDVVGEEMHPIYKFLTQKEKNGLMDSKVTWNFQKYLLNEEGILEKVIDPRTSPDDPEVIDWITSK
ncbi:MAG: glutathione peroxidase [Flavobacteriaceae bacterium]